MDKVLLVDDDDDVRPMLALALRSAGYTVDTAKSKAEALQRLEAADYGLVITDRRLPDGDGIEIADRARQSKAQVLVLSGYFFQLAIEDLQRHEHVMKPIRPTELLHLVRQKIGGEEESRGSA